MRSENCELGMIGLGVMGRNLLLNMAEHGHLVTGYDKDPEKTRTLSDEASARPVHAVSDLAAMIALLKRPRTVMLLVPAGAIVDQVIDELTPHLDAGDLIIDGGNSRFTDTDRRSDALERDGLHFIGMGVSGGARGARYGPSMMPGGSREAYDRMRSLLEDVAAHVDGEPCVTYLGPRSTGHYVKMVHNGIEYGLMQLIAETYDILRRGLGLANDQIQGIYRNWSEADLGGFLIEITADILGHVDEQTGQTLVDVILDAAKQKGTGMWTSQDAMELRTPVPTIDAAVGARDLSGLFALRQGVSKLHAVPVPTLAGVSDTWIANLQRALRMGYLLTYAQGMTLLQTASGHYGYGVSLEDVARIWRGGCIIRAALLEEIRRAYRDTPDLPTLLRDKRLGMQIAECQAGLREVVTQALRAGLPVPALAASLAYFDGLRSSRLPANLIQAQRDYFGSHTYERVDRDGSFHTQWRKDESAAKGVAARNNK
jgi:6-phosphogluconate dehydrogenase